MAVTIPPDSIRAKLAESLDHTPGPLTRRDGALPSVLGNVMAVIGIRRGGKTSFMRDHARAAIRAGRPKESQPILCSAT